MDCTYNDAHKYTKHIKYINAIRKKLQNNVHKTMSTRYVNRLNTFKYIKVKIDMSINQNTL